jgi:signal transduction histidine kinase
MASGALAGISIRSRICLGCATLIMLVFFVFKTLVVFRYIHHSTFSHWFEYLSVIAFMPPFFIVVAEFLQQKKATLSSLSQKNIYLEHAAKIIRHDMHSGINTYLPRGIKSLQRRLTQENIDELKIGAPLRLIEDGLHHAQKVYSGVYEFTNLVKENAVLNTAVCNTKEILEDYLKLTAYKNQVIISDNLPTTMEINEALFCTAIDNLIRNGLKYNDSPTKWVKIYHEGSYHEGSYIIVEDNGRGLTPEEFIELSKPYKRKEGQKESGTGLGLNITIEILKEHGFSIRAEKTETGTKLFIKI